MIALLLIPAFANAQGINLAWRNCIMVTSGMSSAQGNILDACDGSRSAPFVVVLSFVNPTPLPEFIGMSATIGMNSDAMTLPDYWRLGIGECRDGAITFPASLAGIGNTTNCRNPWAGATTTGTWSWISDTPFAAYARATFAQSRDTPTPLIAGLQYIAGAIAIDAAGASEGAPCTGCAVSTCLELIEVRLVQAGGPDILLNTAGTRRIVTWQGGLSRGGGCLDWEPDPVLNRSWGSIKSTYR